MAKLTALLSLNPAHFQAGPKNAARKLIAFGESADSVPETLRRIGDVSAGIQAPVNEIAELYPKWENGNTS